VSAPLGDDRLRFARDLADPDRSPSVPRPAKVLIGELLDEVAHLRGGPHGQHVGVVHALLAKIEEADVAARTARSRRRGAAKAAGHADGLRAALRVVEKELGLSPSVTILAGRPQPAPVAVTARRPRARLAIERELDWPVHAVPAGGDLPC